MRNFVSKAFLASALAVSSAIAAAQTTAPTTVEELASSVDFAGVGLAILAICGAIGVIFVTWRGANIVLSAIKNGGQGR